jgi:hypothetical protein
VSVTYALVKVLVTGAMLATNGLSERVCKLDAARAKANPATLSANCVPLRRGTFLGTTCGTSGEGKISCKIKVFGGSSNEKASTK